MSDFFDSDDGYDDSAFLNELDAIEAATQQPPPNKPVQPSPKLPDVPSAPHRFKPALKKQPSDYFDDTFEIDADELNKLDAIVADAYATSHAPNAPTGPPKAKPEPPPSIRKQSSLSDFDEPFDVDVDELERLDAFIADSYAGKAQPVAGPSRTRQTTLDGRILAPSTAEKTQPKRPFERTKSASREQKSKAWDRTTFSETGFRSTKRPDSKGKEKGKEKNGQRNDDYDEDDDDADLGFEQFPSPMTNVGPPPLMRLKPDLLAAKDWVFPLNRPRRDYQFNIAKKCLFQNTLVALPTGLGKTFIAGVVMLNFYRWFPKGKILFVAPTKPLVAQQVSACHEVCGIPGGDAAQLTGEVHASKRSIAWAQKRVIYMTPQTLLNDMVKGLADPLDIILFVIDEAHRGTGDYAYCQVMRYLMAKNPHFRVLALTATPGNSPEAVQRIVDSLHISQIEIRNEQSFDLQRYLFKKEINVRVIKMDGPVLKLQVLLCKVMEPLLERVRKEQLIYCSSPIMLRHYSCLKGSSDLMNGKNRKAPWMFSYLRVLGSFSRAMGSLMESSSPSCYRILKELKEALLHGDKNDDKNVKLLQNPDYIKLMQECERQQASGFAPHPKMKALVEIIMDHFNAPQSNPDPPVEDNSASSVTQASDSKIMIFVGLREVLDEIMEVLDQYKPLLRAARFVGQGTDKKGVKGLAQAKQIETIQRFKDGEFNILVSTSVGEEGLDIGEIDRIICYDSSKSSIQMLQRVGRTGRKRKGFVDVLLSEDREERNWDKSKENYADVQETIISGNQVELYTDAERLLPDSIQPQCLQITMPIEEYVPITKQNTPAVAKGVVGTKRKRNVDINRNIPLGARNGFVTASELRPKLSKAKKAKNLKDLRESDLEDDSDDEEIGRGLLDSSSLSRKSKSKATKSKKSQSSMKAFLKNSLPDRLEDDDDDLEIEKGIKLSESSSSSDDSDLPIPSTRPRKQQRGLAKLSTSSSDDGPSKSTKKRSSSATTSKASSSGAVLGSPSHEGRLKKPGWLLESDSEAEGLSPSPPRHTGPRYPVSKPNGGLARFRSAKSLGVLEMVSSPEVTPIPIPNVTSTPFKDRDINEGDNSIVTPEPTFAVRRPAKRKNLVPTAPQSSPMDERKGAPRRIVRRGSPDLMPPPPISLSRERGLKKPKLKMKNNPMLFDVEAAHSGDDVSEGDGSDVDIVESDSDRQFLEELPETQVSPSYDQTAAYRLGMMTQAPVNGGPLFANRKTRVGAFAGGRTQVPKPVDWSSSPMRGSETDEYHMGSFVVNDDDSILYDQSSEN